MNFEKYSPEARFWGRVTDTPNGRGCREFTGYQLPSGYCRLRWDGRLDYAHRVAWKLTQGTIPQEELGRAGWRVLHSCGNPACCEPAHLYLRSGTAAGEPIRYRVSREWAQDWFGRQQAPAVWGPVELTEEQAKIAFREGLTVAEAAVE